MRRSVAWLLYAFHFLVAADGNALVPLIPAYTTRFHLSVFDAGLVVAAPAAAMVVLSVPVGVLSDRLGPRVLTVAAGAMLAVSAFGQARADSYAVLLASCALFGITSAIVYTAAPAWLAESATSHRRMTVLGGVATFAGLGLMAGPAFAGLLSERFGIGSPFLVFAIAAVAVTGGLALQRPVRAASDARVSESLGALLREPHGASAVGLMFFVGGVGGIVNLLVPLGLDRAGLGAGPIGVAFTASMALFVLTSVPVARLGHRVPLLAASGVATLALAAVLVLPAVAGSAVLLIVFLLLRAPLWSVVSTISNPLAAHAAELASVGTGFGLAVANMCWGVGNLGGPLAAGALAGAVGDRPVFALLALVGAALAVGVLYARRAPAFAAESIQTGGQ